MPKEKFFGLDYIPQIANETNAEVYCEIGRFVELLLKNNHNILVGGNLATENRKSSNL